MKRVIPPPNKTVNIAFCYSIGKNKNYWKYLVTTILQMLSKCTQNYKYDIYIVSDDDLKKVKDLIDKLAPKNINYEIIPLKFDKNIIGKLLKKSGESLSRYTLGVYYRLFLPKLLPCNIKKICYFDVDVCFKGDVAQYYNLDVAKYDAIACCEGYVDQLQKGLTGHLFNELQTSHKQYFNSGVMLINIRKWRNKQKQLLSAIKSGRFIKLGDQNIINFLFDNIKADISCAGFIYPRWFVIAEPPGFITKNKFIIHTILPKLWGKWTDKHFLYLLFSKQIYLFPLFFQWRSIYRTVEKNSKNI